MGKKIQKITPISVALSYHQYSTYTAVRNFYVRMNQLANEVQVKS